MEWYYNKGDEVVGPISKEEILNLIKENSIGRDTLVWNEGMEDWKVITEVSEFEKGLLKLPPPLPKEIISQLESKVNQDPAVIKTYYDDGDVKSIESRNFRIDGLIYGKWESYYRNGQLEEKKIYKDGKLNGLWEKYSENGQLKWKRTYKNDKLVDDNTGDNKNSVKSPIENQREMKWYKFLIYISIPLGIFQSLLFILIYYNDLPSSGVPSPILSIYSIGVYILLFIGLRDRRMWGLYLYFFNLLSYCFVVPFFMYEDESSIIIHLLISGLFFYLNYDYFNKRKSLFS